MAFQRRRGWLMVAGGLALTVAVVPLFGQQSAQKPDVLDALLVEVRGLRAAIEQMSSAGPRVQLAMGRLQLQEQRINTMVRRLDSVREQKGAAERELADLRDRSAQMEEITERADDPNERKAMADQSRELKRLASHRSVDLQRLATEEAEVSNAISVEQSRWADINRALEALEQSLMRR